MPTNTLTDAACKRAKPAETPIKLFDGGGLHLFVSPTGAKTWRLAFRIDGKPQTKSLGAYPLVSLAEARAARDAIKLQLLAGTDPRKPRTAGASVTLGAAVEQYWCGRQDVTEKYRQNAMRGISMHLGPLLAVPVAKITRDDLLAQLLVMDRAGLYSYVRKVRVWVGLVFDWAVERGHCAINPATQINPEKAFGRQQVESHAALELSDIGPLLHRLSFEARIQSVLAHQMLALTWVRTVELRTMRWADIDGDLWRVPKMVMKKRRDHLVPLSRQALALLDELRQRRGSSEYVFPNDRRDDRPMSENSILYLLARVGYEGRMTGHGWRSVGSTWANEAGHNDDAIERQLAHVPGDKIRAIYNRAEYLPQRAKMLQDWADWLDEQLRNVNSRRFQG